MKQSSENALSAALRDYRFAGVLMDSPGAKVEVFASQEEAAAFQARAAAYNTPVIMIEGLGPFSAPPMRDYVIEVRNADQFVSAVALLRAAKGEGLIVEPHGLVTVTGEIFICLRAAPTGATFLGAALKAAGVPGFSPKEDLAGAFGERDTRRFADIVTAVDPSDITIIAALLGTDADEVKLLVPSSQQLCAAIKRM